MKRRFGVIALVIILILSILNIATGEIRYSYTADNDYIYIMRIKQRILWGRETTLYRIDMNDKNRLEMCFRTWKLYKGISVDDEYLYFSSYDWFKAAVYTTGHFRIKKDHPFRLHNIEKTPDAHYLAQSSDRLEIGVLFATNMRLFRSFFSIDREINLSYWMDKEGNPIGDVWTEDVMRLIEHDDIFIMSYHLQGNEYQYQYYSEEKDDFVDFPIPRKWQNDYAVVNETFYVLELGGIARFNVDTESLEYLITDDHLDYETFAFSDNKVFVGTKDTRKVCVYSLEDGSMIREIRFAHNGSIHILDNLLYSLDGKRGTIRMLDLLSNTMTTYIL
ncbi:MAG: hypothetical protein ACOYI5_05040 [Christensenellales bacterium]|jgi:hypothetical protein